MRYLSVCSGIEAATVAWHSLGWLPVAFSEIDPFASALLAKHYPNVPNLGDMTKHDQWKDIPAFDVLVGGTPCQSFSVAGLRRGLEDPRGSLMLTYLGILDRFRPRWCVWENVPGVLSSSGGRDFGAFLGALGELGYGFAYRVLDAQYVRVESHPRAVPQRRRRVFVVGHLGGWRRAAEVLLEPEGVRGDSAPRREAGKGFARGVGSGPARGGQSQGVAEAISFKTDVSEAAGAFFATNGFAPTLQAANSRSNTPVVAFKPSRHTRGQSQGVAEVISFKAGQSEAAGAFFATNGFAPTLQSANNGSTAVPAVAFKPSHHTRGKDGAPSEVFLPLSADTDKGDQDAVVLAGYAVTAGNQSNPSTKDFIYVKDIGVSVPIDRTGADPTNRQGGTLVLGPDRPSVSERGQAVAHTLSTQCGGTTEGGTGRGSPLVAEEVAASRAGMAVRRLTPRECERLQGFPDDHTLIEYRGKPAADGKRYNVLGNSMAVNVMRFIGERIAFIEARTDDNARSVDDLRELSETEQERIRVAAGLPSKRHS